jgi:hypothetical protein
MRKFLVLAGVLILFALPAAAQNTPASEAFIGYQYQRFSPGDGESGINLNGWTGSLAVNANSWFGVVGEIAGAYGNPQMDGSPVSVRHHTFLVGPRITARGHRVQPFVHVLFGGSRFSLPDMNQTEAFWAWDFGGGVDVRLSDRVLFRLAQVDYLGTRYRLGELDRSTQKNFRYSAGLVFHFGDR